MMAVAVGFLSDSEELIEDELEEAFTLRALDCQELYFSWQMVARNFTSSTDEVIGVGQRLPSVMMLI